MLFDDYPRFLDTSATASNRKRLRLRHRAMFGSNAEIFTGARVLDIASHDGRWSMAALQAGAAHATGIEANPDLLKSAEETFEHYDVPRDTYRFVNDDIFDVLGDPGGHEIDVDVVMCIGFIYHTLRYQELFSGVRALNPRHFLVDTAVILDDEPMVKLFSEDVSKESSGLDHTFARAGRLVTGRPSVPALEMLLETHGFTVVKRFDWQGFLERHHPEAKVVGSYREGRRVTWLCSPS